MKSVLITRADWLIIIAAITLLPWLYATFWSSSGSAGDEVHIMVDGKELPAISLKQEQTLTIQGSIGPSILKIANGGVRFISSPCQGQQCVHSGWHYHSGEFTACLPNRIALQVTGGTARFDTFNY